MPDPISSLSPSTEPNACIDETSEASAANLAASASNDAGPPALPSAVKGLVAHFSPPLLPKPVVGGTESGVGYSYSGPSSDGASRRTEVAFVKSPAQAGATQGTDFQALDVSQVSGKDHDLQATLLHANLAASHAGYGLAVALEGPAARANLGEHNDDGSLGGNLGAGVELVGVEATLSTPIGSLTAGASASVAVSGSIGVRDSDHDGKPEFCAKVSIPAYTVGACLEQFW